ncbi:MAG: C-terminal binding protein [Gemmataceae bacterium]
MAEFHVLLSDFIADDLAPERDVLKGVATVTGLDAHTQEEVIPYLDRVDAVISYHLIHWDRAMLSRMPKCKVLARGGVGTDNVDLPVARELGIPVVNVPDYGTEEVADSAISLMLSLVRGTNLYNRKIQRGEGPWNHLHAKPLTRLRGKVFGIIGIGRIGTAAALRAKALGMDVVFYDPYVEDGTEKSLGIRRADSIEELVKQSFVVSPHCPLTKETEKIIRAEVVALMPKGSYLINTSRGGVVDATCIPDAIRSGQLAGAGIDVLPLEPPPADHPLIAAWRDPQDPCYDRVIVTPHAAFYSEEGLTHIRVKTAEACRRALTGQPLRNVVNR